MTPLATFVVWVVLLLLLGLEFVVGRTAALCLGAAMAILVALTYMRLARTPGVPAAFALAAVFWLTVLLGLGSLDSATRHDILVTPETEQTR